MLNNLELLGQAALGYAVNTGQLAQASTQGAFFETHFEPQVKTMSSTEKQKYAKFKRCENPIKQSECTYICKK